jgi:hypothetical protein
MSVKAEGLIGLEGGRMGGLAHRPRQQTLDSGRAGGGRR